MRLPTHGTTREPTRNLTRSLTGFLRSTAGSNGCRNLRQKFSRLPKLSVRRTKDLSRYFAFLAFAALIFAHRALADRAIFARTAADIVLLPLAPFGLLACPGDTATVLPPFRAAMAPLTAANCRCSFDSSDFNAPIISMKPPLDI
jgi:hypothetical protein